MDKDAIEAIRAVYEKGNRISKEVSISTAQDDLEKFRQAFFKKQINVCNVNERVKHP